MTDPAQVPWLQMALAGALAVACVERLLRMPHQGHRYLHHIGGVWAGAGALVSVARVLARLGPEHAVAASRLEWTALLSLPIALAAVATPRCRIKLAVTSVVSTAGLGLVFFTDRLVGSQVVARSDPFGHPFWVPVPTWAEIPAALYVAGMSVTIAWVEIRRTADPLIRASLERGALPAVVGASIGIFAWDRAIDHGLAGVQLLPWTALASVLMGEGWNARRAGSVARELEQRVQERTVALQQETRRALDALAEAEAAREAQASAEASRDQSLRELMAAERMVSMGLVAGGVAHEINNPLQLLSANLEFLRERLPADASAQEALDDAVMGVQRIADTIRGFRTLAGKGEPGEHALDVNEAVRSAARLVDPEVRRHTDLVVEAGVAPLVRGNEGRLVHVLVHLLLVAAQRVARGDGRSRVAVRTSAARNGVAIEIEAAGAFDALAEPDSLVSPHEVEQGLLGLSVGRSLVERSGGRLETLDGDRLWVWLPAADARTPSPQLQAPGAADPYRLLMIQGPGPAAQAIAKSLRGFAEVELVGELDEALARWAEGGADAIACSGGCGPDLVDELVRRFPEDAHRALLLLGAESGPREKQLAERRPLQVLAHPLERQALVERLQHLGRRRRLDARRG